MPLTLHYIFDPLCGWCYGATPLVDAARRIPGLRVVLHAGGMMTGDNRRRIDEQWRNYVVSHDRRIASLSGQPFGEAYFEGLLHDEQAVMDSEPPTTAILAAEAMAGRGLDMLHRIQRAHYVEGRRVADEAVLRALAPDIGLDVQAFTEGMARLAGRDTWVHIAASRSLLSAVGGAGFPTFVLDDGGGRPRVLNPGAYLGRTSAWVDTLKRALAATRGEGSAPA